RAVRARRRIEHHGERARSRALARTSSPDRGDSMTRAIACCLAAVMVAAAPPPPRAVEQGKDGKLAYATSANGDRIIDFSTCGYRGGDEPILSVPVRVIVSARDGDATAPVRAAIDYVASLPPDEHGFRGAVLL